MNTITSSGLVSDRIHLPYFTSFNAQKLIPGSGMTNGDLWMKYCKRANKLERMIRIWEATWPGKPDSFKPSTEQKATLVTSLVRLPPKTEVVTADLEVFGDRRQRATTPLYNSAIGLMHSIQGRPYKLQKLPRLHLQPSLRFAISEVKKPCDHSQKSNSDPSLVKASPLLEPENLDRTPVTAFLSFQFSVFIRYPLVSFPA